MLGQLWSVSFEFALNYTILRMGIHFNNEDKTNTKVLTVSNTSKAVFRNIVGIYFVTPISML